MVNRTEHHTKVSELGFTVSDEDFPAVVQYAGEWTLTGEGPVPNNYWAVTIDGEGIPFSGHPSPRQILDEANGEGLNCAYVAPYGRYVEGKLDGVQLHDWIREHRH
ncbi:hypothetical protein [Alicyclobacillus pomorum]|jgi:hypothetical protein|uniref:hypothetical protein n=1 Tax=Alicyclobacillus pomorum TaxID=204470 RepID=UPI00041E4A80|nr:hypothetical protein [Alicyclobacillus pomorum]